MPELSVLMSCFNAEKTVKRAIQSILNQSFENFEFIIIDDCSSDATPQILDQYQKQDPRIRVLTNESNLGLAASLNKGIGVCNCPIIARMDADDHALPQRFQLQLAFFNANEEVDILGSAVQTYYPKTDRLGNVIVLPSNHVDIIKRIFKKTLVFHPTIMIRKKIFDEIAQYDPHLKWAEDSDLWYRIYDKVTFHNLEEPLLIYTVKSRLNWKIISQNWKVKTRNLQDRKMLFRYLPFVVYASLSQIFRSITAS